MKTTKILLALSISMILFGSNVFAIKTSSGNSWGPGLIRYQVNINISANLKVSNLQLLVMMKDGNNRLVAPPQQFRIGTPTYTFSERGPVRGIRVAMIVLSNSDGTAILLYDNTDVRRGVFDPGHLYPFQIFPKIGNQH